MKKKLLLAMFTIATVFSLVACGGDKETSSKKEDTKKEESKKDDKDKDDDKKSSDEDKDISDLIGALTGKDNEDDEDDITPEPTEAPTLAPTEAPKATEAPEVTEAPEATEVPKPTKAPSAGTDSVTTVGYEEMVDNTISTDQFNFRIESIDINDKDKLAIKVVLENKSDLELYFTWNNTYVNSFSCDPYWSDIVDPGETTESTISFRYSDFDLLKVNAVTSLHFELSVSDFNNWSADPILESTYVYFPEGKNAAASYKYDFDADDTLVAEVPEATMAILDYGFNEDSDFEVTLYLENNTENAVMFVWDDCFVNTYLLDPYFANELAAGMKNICKVTFDAEELALAEITDVTRIDFEGRIYNSDDWSVDSYVEEVFTVYPKGKAADGPQVRAPKDTDIVLVDTDALSIIVVDSFTDDDSNYNMVLYYENKLSDKELSFSVDSTTINDWGFDVFNYDSIPAGKKGFSTFKWYAYDLEVRDITDITSVQLPIEVICYDTWPTTKYVNETFTVNP